MRTTMKNTNNFVREKFCSFDKKFQNSLKN